MNQGKLLAFVVAGHASQYFQVHGRWPANRQELEAFDCPDVMDDPFESRRAPGCPLLKQLPYRIEWRPAPRKLQMVFRNTSDQLVCKLTVSAPKSGDPASMQTASITISPFGCPGEGESFK